jgi:uncharacterized membrane protein YdjX (TVP38/TMEM64 family)
VVAALLALPEPSGDILGTVGVFLSGMGTLLTAFVAFHYERKRGEQECERRFQAFREGMRIKDESK